MSKKSIKIIIKRRLRKYDRRGGTNFSTNITWFALGLISFYGETA
jgi:hypothetical protein